MFSKQLNHAHICPTNPMNEPCKYYTLTPLQKASPKPNMKAVCQKVKNDPLEVRYGKG